MQLLRFFFFIKKYKHTILSSFVVHSARTELWWKKKTETSSYRPMEECTDLMWWKVWFLSVFVLWCRVIYLQVSMNEGLSYITSLVHITTTECVSICSAWYVTDALASSYPKHPKLKHFTFHKTWVENLNWML